MPTIPFQITAFVSDHFPGFVEGILIDAFGAKHTFVAKVPATARRVTMEDFNVTTKFERKLKTRSDQMCRACNTPE